MSAVTAEDRPDSVLDTSVIFDIRNLSVSYKDLVAVQPTSLTIPRHTVTALIGPSGCGKSSFLRRLNRMNDLIPSAKIDGQVIYHDADLYAREVDPVQVRKYIGKVFQKPNPFPKSIFDNVAFGPRVLGTQKRDVPGIVEEALQRAAIWDEVKDRLKDNAFRLSGGQQQRLCIARALATNPDVILMDEPCSALDPISTSAIEELLTELSSSVTVVMVTHNMQQAARVSSMTAFFDVEQDETDHRSGHVVEYDTTDKIFSMPEDPRTEAYITGKFG